MMEILTTLAENMAIINNFLLLAFFFTFAIVFWKENKDNDSLVNWTDLLIDERKGKGRGKISLTKLGQFWGIAISSWIAIYMAQKLTPEQISVMYPWIFGTWLTFLVAQTGIKAFKANSTSVSMETNDPLKEDKKDAE